MIASPRRAAQALVEAALTLPLMLSLTLGVLQVVLYAHAHEVLASAAQEGARLSAEDGRGADEGEVRIAEVVRAGLGSSVDPLRIVPGGDLDTVSFRVEAAPRPILPLPMITELPLHAEASVARERFRPTGGGR